MSWMRTDYVLALQPMLNVVGTRTDFSIALFMPYATTYERRLAPIAGHYSCVELGPAGWFLDSPEAMRCFRKQMTETASFYRTVGFSDDIRLFLSVPARRDVARPVDCNFPARSVAEGRLYEDEAHGVAQDLTVGPVRRAYKLDADSAATSAAAA